jgi:hypothetical protein
MIEKQTIAERSGPLAIDKPSATGKHPPFRHLLLLIIIGAILLSIALATVTGYIQKWLWMRQLDYAGIFWTLLSVQWAMFCSAFVFVFLYLWINLRQAARSGAAFQWDRGGEKRASLSGADSVAQSIINLSPRLFKSAVVLIGRAPVGRAQRLGETRRTMRTARFPARVSIWIDLVNPRRQL